MDISRAIRKRLEEGLQEHQRGALEAAQVIYQGVLDDDPENADAYHFLGLIAHQQQNFKTAVTFIQKAIAGDNARPTFHFNLGAAQLALVEPRRHGPPTRESGNIQTRLAGSSF